MSSATPSPPSSPSPCAPAVRYQRGDSDERPWGRWEVLETGPGFVVKRITVTPGAQLSLQAHTHRAEHWVIVRGTATVTLDDAVFEAPANQAIFIPTGARHRIANRTDGIVEFIEVQTGSVLDEADIIRFEDSYGRAG